MNRNWLILLLAGAMLSACVTINIYFPAAAAGKAADKIIDEIMQSQQGGKAAPRTNENQPAAPGADKEETK
jgi:hypothetical protein